MLASCLGTVYERDPSAGYIISEKISLGSWRYTTLDPVWFLSGKGAATQASLILQRTLIFEIASFKFCLHYLVLLLECMV